MTTTWVVAEALKALADRRPALGVGSEFTAANLADWTEGRLNLNQRRKASSKLIALEFVAHRVTVIEGERADVYRVTPAGAAAIEAAGAGHVRRSGPKGPTGPRKPKPDTFVARLWALMRIRKMLTPTEGAELLCDAGDGKEAFERRRDTASRCLRRWRDAGVLGEGAKRVGASGRFNRGELRFVLVVDTIDPPVRQQASPSSAGKGGAE